MSENTRIEWCDHTFNPWTGCTKVSPGCANCYAEGWAKRSGIVRWGKGAPRRRTSEANWKLPLKWNRDVANGMPTWDDDPLARPRVFCASLADWLDEEVPVEWLYDLLNLIRRTPNLDWLLLTKRPENFRPRLTEILRLMGRHLTLEESYLRTFITLMMDGGWAESIYTAPQVGRENYWIGTTVEDQARADERIPELLQIPAKVRFLSCEPLLSPVDLLGKDEQGSALHSFEGRPRVDWVICGGESGHGARPMHPDWARSLRDQCQAADVPFLFKQWGEWHPAIDDGMQFIGYDNEFLDSPMQRIGKKAAGRVLDGREWNEFPKVEGGKA